MQSHKKEITILSKTSKDAEEFLRKLRQLVRGKNIEEQITFFIEVKDILYELSEFKFAIKIVEQILEYAVHIQNKRLQLGCYMDIGASYASLRDYEKAIIGYTKGLAMSRELAEHATELKLRINIGFAYGSLGDLDKAIEFIEKSVDGAKEIGDKESEATCYETLCITYVSIGDFSNAAQKCKQALVMEQYLSKDSKSEVYKNMLDSSLQLGNFSEAVEFGERALKVVREVGDTDGELKCNLSLAVVYEHFGDFRKVIYHSERILDIAREVGDRVGEGTAYSSLGNAYTSLGDFNKAIEFAEKALGIQVQIGNKYGEELCYINLGVAYHGLGDFNNAILFQQKALEIQVQIGDRNGAAKSYGNLGLVYLYLSDYKRAIEFAEKALGIQVQLGDRYSAAKSYGNLGSAYHGLDDLGKAIEFAEKALGIQVQLGDRYGQAVSYNNLSNDYYSMGDYERAIEVGQKALDIAREVGDNDGEANNYGIIGLSYLGLGDPITGIMYSEKALEIQLELGNRYAAAKSHQNVGVAYSATGDFRKAIEHYEKSFEIKKEIGDRSGEAKYYRSLGVAYHALGDFEKAIDSEEKGLAISIDIGDLDLQRTIELILGTFYINNRPKKAYDYLKRSIVLAEELAGNLIREEDKIAFYGFRSNAYEYMVPLCLRLGNTVEAFEYAERSKSRTFLNMLSSADIRPSVDFPDNLKPLLKEEQEYLTKLQEIQTRHVKKLNANIDPSRIDHIKHELNEIYNKIEKADPEYVSLRRAKPLPLDRLQNIFSQRGNAALVEYFLTQDKIFIFVVSDHKLHIKTIEMSQQKLTSYVQSYWREVVNYPKFGDMGNTWLELSDYLIEPISELLSRSSLLCFVPYGLLHYLPIHALELNEQPLIKNYAILYSPSASMVQFYASKGSGKLNTCGSFGVTTGQEGYSFGQETKEVAKIFSSTPYLDATKNQVLVNIDNDILHFACHGYFNNIDPLSSGIKLSDDMLTAREIFDLKLNSELVALSACETGMNETKPGDELIGLTRALMYAGASSVIVSLWSVYDPSTRELMLEFYKLLKEGKDKATALQQAQIKIMEKEEYSHPYFWAPFVLVGDWK